MKLVVIFGPHAVGKMTVGQELEKLTGLRLFHNHMTIDLVSNFFGYGTSAGKRLVELFRKEIFEEVSKSDLEGLIFTYVWAFDEKSDSDYLERLCEIFREKEAEIYFVELEADINERLERNKSEHRLNCKPTKRNIEWSEKNLIESAKTYRLNSNDGEIKENNYIRIDNTFLEPDEVSRLITKTFKL